MDFRPNARTTELLARIQSFMEEHVFPVEADVLKTMTRHNGQWQPSPIIETLKQKARAEGLWNLFLPDEIHGAGLTNLEYAPLAEAMGHSFIAPEVFNCSAPDTGNMEVLVKYGTEEQKRQWLEPLLAGTIRSCFAMTEPQVASSDATNMQATIEEDGDELVINGRKWYISGFADPRTEIIIFMGLSNPEAPRHQQHSMVLIPKNTPGVEFIRHMEVFGRLDEFHGGHAEIAFNNVRVPRNNLLLGPGRGFEIAQGRLGPGRIHHCMRAIGAAERALKLMIERGLSREAFGNQLIHLGGNHDLIADSRIDIECARLLTLKAAWMIDELGVKAAMSEISQIKVLAPNITRKIIDRAIQIHGACGVSDDTPLSAMYALNRMLRLADGPDEVHRELIARQELKKYR